jgi:hypothetical protein
MGLMLHASCKTINQKGELQRRKKKKKKKKNKKKKKDKKLFSEVYTPRRLIPRWPPKS